MDNARPVIIAVDDQPLILHTVALELRELYTVKAFTSGSAALKYLADQPADLIILDYEMPEMNGYEVLKRLREDKKTAGIPVVFLTGSDNCGAEVEVLEKGASDYIQKPIKVQVLLTRVRLQLELARYRNHLEALVEEKTESLRLSNEKLKHREEVTLSLLAEATDMRDHDTGGHIGRVTEIVRIIVTELLENPISGYELTKNEADDIIRSAKLHDLGKIAVPDHILLKPGRLDSGEFEVIMLHPLHGANLFTRHIASMGDDAFLNTAREIALNHHEKWDGTGYPNRISGNAIPLSARITALADVYDALTSSRPYKEPFEHSEAVKIIADNSGTHFDPVLVQVFLRHGDRFRNLNRDISMY